MYQVGGQEDVIKNIEEQRKRREKEERGKEDKKIKNCS